MNKKFFGVALSFVPGIGNVLYKRLIEHFKRAEVVFKTTFKELMEVEGIGPQTASAIKNFDREILVEKELLAVEKANAGIITLEDDCYPSNLFKISDPPSILYVKGNITKADQFAVAVVGSRTPSKYGKCAANLISRDLATEGITIVSGMARGIDSICHKEALRAGGRTIAVLGNGIDIIYPPENEALYHEIIKNGAVISDFPIATPPDSVNFPDRNRIISGLSLGVVVVEAGTKSGSLITARFAASQGRNVFAVPGQIGSMRSKGTNRLIKNGASLLEHANDVVDIVLPEYRNHRATRNKTRVKENLSENAKLVLTVLTEGPLHIDMVTARSRLNVNEVSSILLTLELDGLITHLPGKIFIKN